jgi:hypothetical protein
MDEAQYDVILAAAAANFPPEWGVSDYQAMDTFDGIAYSGHITFEGVPIAFFVNDGRGGITMIQWNDGRPPAAWVQMATPLRILGSENEELLLESLLDKFAK